MATRVFQPNDFNPALKPFSRNTATDFEMNGGVIFCLKPKVRSLVSFNTFCITKFKRRAI